MVAADAAADPSLWTTLAPILTVLGAILVAWITARGTFRASANNTRTIADTETKKLEHARDAALDARVDAQLHAAWQECDRLRETADRLRRERDEQAELHQRLRIGVIAVGLDPDQITPRPWRRPDGHEPAALPHPS